MNHHLTFDYPLPSPCFGQGYISSTSVYGDHGGRPVNENTLPSNPSRKGQLRLAAEDEWRAFANSTASSLCIFRLSGIYGPGRSALHTFHRNPSVLSDTRDTLDMIVSRVHLDDIVAALVAAVAADRKTMQKADHLLAQDMTVNISDDLPATRRDVFNYASKLLSRNARAALDDDNVERRVSGRNLYRASKRVSNHKMKQILLPQLRYPTYKEGFAALIREVL